MLGNDMVEGLEEWQNIPEVLRKAFTAVRDSMDVQRQHNGTLAQTVASVEHRLQALEDGQMQLGTQVKQMELQVASVQGARADALTELRDCVNTLSASSTSASEAMRNDLAAKSSVVEFNELQQEFEYVKGQLGEVTQRHESIHQFVSSGQSLMQHKYQVQQLVQEELLRCTDTDVLKMPSASLIRLRKLEGSIHLLSSNAGRLEDTLRMLGQKQDAVMSDVVCAVKMSEDATKVSREARRASEMHAAFRVNDVMELDREAAQTAAASKYLALNVRASSRNLTKASSPPSSPAQCAQPWPYHWQQHLPLEIAPTAARKPYDSAYDKPYEMRNRYISGFDSSASHYNSSAGLSRTTAMAPTVMVPTVIDRDYSSWDGHPVSTSNECRSSRFADRLGGGTGDGLRGVGAGAVGTAGVAGTAGGAGTWARANRGGHDPYYYNKGSAAANRLLSDSGGGGGRSSFASSSLAVSASIGAYTPAVHTRAGLGQGSSSTHLEEYGGSMNDRAAQDPMSYAATRISPMLAGHRTDAAVDTATPNADDSGVGAGSSAGAGSGAGGAGGAGSKLFSAAANKLVQKQRLSKLALSLKTASTTVSSDGLNTTKEVAKEAAKEASKEASGGAGATSGGAVGESAMEKISRLAEVSTHN
jgi:hypothetical protein